MTKASKRTAESGTLLPELARQVERLTEALDKAEDRLGEGLTEEDKLQAMHDAMQIISQALQEQSDD